MRKLDEIARNKNRKKIAWNHLFADLAFLLPFCLPTPAPSSFFFLLLFVGLFVSIGDVYVHDNRTTNEKKNWTNEAYKLN